MSPAAADCASATSAPAPPDFPPPLDDGALEDAAVVCVALDTVGSDDNADPDPPHPASSAASGMAAATRRCRCVNMLAWWMRVPERRLNDLRNMLSPFRSPAFRLYFAGQATSALADGMVTVALAFAVLDVTGSVGALGVVLGARTVCSVAGLLFGG
jgi:hypothetical protein